MRPVLLISAATVILALTAGLASAQPVISAKSGVIAGVAGKVALDGKELEPSETHFPEMKEGSVVKTEEGRVEVMLPPGFMLRIGEHATMKLLANRLMDTRVDLQAGSGILEVDQVSQDYHVTIALKDGDVTFAKAGVYRLDYEPGRLKVFEGQASVEYTDKTTVTVSKGHMVSLSGTAAAVEKFDLEQTDDLDNWARRRAEEMALANVSGAKYNGANGPKGSTGGSWNWNVYLGLYTYIPYWGRPCINIYGICYYSPSAMYQTFVAPPILPPTITGGSPSYIPAMSGTSNSTATSVASAPAMSSSPAAPAASSTSAGAAAASSGHGSAASGGHGK